MSRLAILVALSLPIASNRGHLARLLRSIVIVAAASMVAETVAA